MKLQRTTYVYTPAQIDGAKTSIELSEIEALELKKAIEKDIPIASGLVIKYHKKYRQFFAIQFSGVWYEFQVVDTNIAIQGTTNQQEINKYFE